VSATIGNYLSSLPEDVLVQMNVTMAQAQMSPRKSVSQNMAHARYVWEQYGVFIPIPEPALLPEERIRSARGLLVAHRNPNNHTVDRRHALEDYERILRREGAIA
jgi:hypothetical protein